MKTVEEYLREAEVAHGHLCAGQVLGVRLAMLGLRKLEIADPRGADRKRLVTFVEIDRCATDAVSLVTGCRLGKRALKFRDWGKVAAQLRRADRTALWLYVGCGVTTSLGSIFVSLAMARMEIALAVLVVHTTPLVIFPVSVFILKNREELTQRTLLGAFLVLSGIALLALR